MAFKISKRKEALKHGLLWFVLLFAFYPLFLMIAISFKNNRMFNANPFLPSAWDWTVVSHNWSKAWNLVGNSIANSIVISVGAVSFCLVMSVLAAYVLARHRFPGGRVVYYGLIATMFLPGTAATLMTTFTVLKGMGMNNSLWAMVVMGAVGGQVVCVFILRQFIEDIPKELFESAQIDGAGHLQQIRNIILPLSGSVLGTLAIMQFIGNWNSLMLPLVILRDAEKLPITVGLMRLEGEYDKQWGELMAGYTISSIPLVILFLFTMRLFVKGLSQGAIKG